MAIDPSTFWNAARTAFEGRRFADALAAAAQVLEIDPGHTEALQLSALVHRELGSLPKAVEFLSRAVGTAPTMAALKLQLGALFQEAGRQAEAREQMEACIQLGAPHPQAYLGLAQLHGDDPQRAMALLREATQRFPGSGEAWNNLGLILASSNQLDAAIPCFRRASEVAPGLLAAHLNLGQALIRQRDALGAQEALRRAAALRPAGAAEFARMLEGLGDELVGLGRREDAETALKGALVLDPTSKGAHQSLALMRYRQARFTEAKLHYEKALARDATDILTLNNYGNLLKAMGLASEAAKVLAQAKALHTGQWETHSNYLFALNDLEDWSPDALFEAHKAYGREFGVETAEARAPITDPVPGRKLRVGLVSGDFHRHSCWYFYECLFEHLDREAFELWVFSTGSEKDLVTEGLKRGAGAWHELGARSLGESEALIRREAVDVLIDLSGHSARNRLPVFVNRPAPVQFTWLGYPNTTGLTCFDGRITDEWADPPGSEAHHTEPLVRLPGGFLAYKPLITAPKPAAPPSVRKGFTTFGSFNALHKQNGRTLRLWGRVLAAAPEARLLLKAHQLADPGVQALTRKRAAEAGIPPDRLDLRGWDSSPEFHLERYGDVDIALDPVPYNGTTTTCEAMWMGVPVVTLAGDRHAARVGASLLNQVGLARLIASDEDAYVRIALELAMDATRLADLRASLRARLVESSLCDRKGFARKFEALIRSAWVEACANSR
ncbi:MAG: tetratricopeptide repeat protein [Holophagaceae bacterium]|nr:tetratricopeptide repeat protein [Holophagaceae bacterium]